MNENSHILVNRIDVPFTQVPNAVLNSPALSWKAKGLFSYLMSKPDGWVFYSTDIVGHGADGKGAVLSGMKELIENGFLQREQHSKNGRFQGNTYTLMIPETLDPQKNRGLKTRIRKTAMLNNKEENNTNSKKTKGKKAEDSSDGLFKVEKKEEPAFSDKFEKQCLFIQEEYNKLAKKYDWTVCSKLTDKILSGMKSRLKENPDKGKWREFFKILEKNCSHLGRDKSKWVPNLRFFMRSSDDFQKPFEDWMGWEREKKTQSSKPGASREGYTERNAVNNLGLLDSQLGGRSMEKTDYWGRPLKNGFRIAPDGTRRNYWGLIVNDNHDFDDGPYELAKYDVDKLIEMTGMQGRVHWDREKFEEKWGPITERIEFI